MNQNARVSIIMGSTSDLPVMANAAQVLEEFGVPFEVTAISAHRAPDRLMEYAKSLAKRNVQVAIAGAGGAAHLPGVLAGLTPIPVIGVPIKSSISLDGWDSLLSIVQMPGGVPVATVGVDGSKNAGLLALRILGAQDGALQAKMTEFMQEQRDKVLQRAEELEQKGYKAFLS